MSKQSQFPICICIMYNMYNIFASSEFWPSGQPKHGGNREGSLDIDRVMPRLGLRNMSKWREPRT